MTAGNRKQLIDCRRQIVGFWFVGEFEGWSVGERFRGSTGERGESFREAKVDEKKQGFIARIN
ncbi:hypothetical protein DRF62_20160 [Chryseobacterium piscium]|uniref:Uncharacterized protein n=1 Tax=Chryseobacterium piscium TaxID=333702 RepID=A0A3D9AZZ2_9FLAO|nr:hypothetical protein DRF62_20160 [Chryseobacterium piscium]